MSSSTGRQTIVAWLDEMMDEDDPRRLEAIRPLYEIADCVILLAQLDMCIALVEAAYQEKLIIVASPSLGHQFTSQYGDRAQVAAIYIISDEPMEHEYVGNNANKLQGVYQSIQGIYRALRHILKYQTESSVSISSIDLPEDETKIDLDQLEPSFIYTKLMKEILICMNHDVESLDRLFEFLQEMNATNSHPSRDLQEFIRTYHPETAIRWYTRSSFLYATLNRALRSLDTNVIVRMGSFLHDLHQQIEQAHKDQLHQYDEQPFVVYRGQALSKIDFQKL